jgi:hypothetical protein
MIRLPESYRNLFASQQSRLRGSEGLLSHEVWWTIVSSFHIILPAPTIICAEIFGHMRASSGCRSGVALGVSLVSCLGAAYGHVMAGDGVARMPRTQGRCTLRITSQSFCSALEGRGSVPRCDKEVRTLLDIQEAGLPSMTGCKDILRSLSLLSWMLIHPLLPCFACSPTVIALAFR